MADVEIRQYWVRNQQGKVFGPMPFATIDLLITNSVLEGRLQVSVDGERYADPGRFPDVREAFPEELWGSQEPLPANFIQRSGEAPPTVGRPSGPPVMGRAGAPIAPNRVAPAVPRTPSSVGPGPGAAPARPAGAPPVAAAPAAELPAPTAADAPLTSGEVATESLFRVLYRAAVQAVTGAVVVEDGSVRREMVLRKGIVQVVRSSVPEEGVLPFLVKKGLLTADAESKAQAALGQFGGDAVAACFALGLVTNPGEVVAALGQHGTGLFHRLMTTASGRWTFDGAVVPPGGAMPLGTKWGVFAPAMRALPPGEAKRRLVGAAHHPVMKAAGKAPLAELGLNAPETRLHSGLEGVKSPAQLTEGAADAEVVLRLCWVLFELELVSFAGVSLPPPAGWKEAVAAPPPAEPTPAPVPAPPPPAAAPPVAAAPAPAAAPAQAPAAAARPPPVVAAAPRAPPVMASASGAAKPAAPVGKPPALAPAAPRVPPQVSGGTPAPAPPPRPAPPTDLDSLRTLVAKHTNQDHFQVLGLDQKATTPAIRTEYLRLVRAYHPDSTLPTDPPEARDLREKLFARINEANEVLSHDATRATYLEELALGASAKEQVDVERIFRAEELFTKATIVTKARKYADALKMFDEAISLNAEEPEFHAWRAYAEFMSHEDKRAVGARALQTFDQVLKRAPKCAPACYFAGLVHKLLGDNAKAMKAFKAAFEIDPHHVDAQREFKALGGK